MAQKYVQTHEVSFFECDVNRTMTIPAILGVAIKASEIQSEELGRGTAFIQQFGLTWVVTSYVLEITRLPKVDERISISTKATEYNKYFCYRQFWLHDQAGNELVMIEAVFSLMDIKKRKLSSVKEEIVSPYESQKIQRIKRFPKLATMQSDAKWSYRVRFNDIDSNQHVNNAVYLNWMFDVLGFDFLTTYTPKLVLIRFDKEVAYGQQVDSHFELTETGSGKKTSHEIRTGEQLNSVANIYWQKK
ncbi:MAG: acyl-ACP thioesterase domain-containing protein [Enterococcus sp.]